MKCIPKTIFIKGKMREGTQGRDYKEANERREVLEGRKWMDG
jgi:hypothetical protein